MEEVEKFKNLDVWFDRKLQGNVHLEKMVNKAKEWVGKVMWMSRVNGQVELDRGQMVWEFMGRLSVEHAAEVWWSGGRSVSRKLESAQMRVDRMIRGKQYSSRNCSAGRSRVA